MITHMKYKHLFTFGSVMIVAWVLGTFAFIYLDPNLTVNNFKPLFAYLSVIIVVWVLGTFAFIHFYPQVAFYGIKRLITQRGADATTSSGIPINTLYAVPNRASPTASSSKILTTGTDDVLYVIGWLDLSKGPQVLHVPDFSERYYSVQFTDSSDGAAFAYVGTRATGTQAGDYLITGPGWTGQVPSGITQISSPNNSVLVIGRVLVESDSDLSTAYDLSKQIQLTPLSHWQPSQ
jgi:hypothetical protein